MVSSMQQQLVSRLYRQSERSLSALYRPEHDSSSFLSCPLPCTAGYIGEFEYVDDHRGGKIVVELNGRSEAHVPYLLQRLCNSTRLAHPVLPYLQAQQVWCHFSTV